MTNADQGITRDQRGEEQPTDKDRAQTAHKSKSDNAVSREATRDTDGHDGKPSK